MIKRAFIGIIILAIIILSACSDKQATSNNSKEETETSNPEESETPEGFARFDIEQDGEMVILEQSIDSPKQLPIDFILPLPNGENQVTGSDRLLWPDGNITYRVTLQSPMEFDSIVDFYEKTLSNMSLTVLKETYEPTSLAIISAEHITVTIEDIYDPQSFEVTIVIDKE